MDDTLIELCFSARPDQRSGGLRARTSRSRWSASNSKFRTYMTTDHTGAAKPPETRSPIRLVVRLLYDYPCNHAVLKQWLTSTSF